MDFLKYENDRDVNDLLDMFLQNLSKPYILLQTFFTKSGYSSLIDNIFYNGLEKNCISGNFDSPITDHLPELHLIKNS